MTTFINKKQSTLLKKIMLQLIFLALSYLSVYIFSSKGYFYGGGDIKFHLSRITELTNAIQNHNNLLAPFSFSSFRNVGAVSQQFYPNITLLPFALLRIVFPHPLLAFYIGIIIYTYLGFIVGYYAMMRFTGNNVLQSVCFTVLFNFSVYHLTDIFNRFDIGEWIALSFFPLAFLGAYELFFRNWHSWYLAAIGLTLIAYSHVLSTLLALSVCFLFAIIACYCKTGDLHARAKAALKASLLTLGMTLFEIVPMIVLSVQNKIHFPRKYNLLRSPGGKLPDIFSFIGLCLKNQLNMSLGIFVLLIIIAGVIYWKKMPKLYQVSLGLTILFTVVTTTIFPWGLFQHTPVAVIQFPWRLLGIAAFFMALTGSWLLEYLCTTPFFSRLNFEWIVCVAILIAAFPGLCAAYSSHAYEVQTYQFIKHAKEENTHARFILPGKYYYSYFSNMNNTAAHTDYYPQKAYAQRYSILHNLIYKADGSTQRMPPFNFTHNHLSFKLYSSKKQLMNLPLLHYFGDYYELSVNGHVQQIRQSTRGTFLVNVAKGKNTIKITLKNKPYRTVLQLFSLVLWLLTCFLLFKYKHTHKNLIS
ncbi:hypothetical protein [Liquorilactobacillus satsumensis]|uniref:hypothetical protein n=1 Tax=Liquorilactobacillus satsumensis TaxID=259059 RepID=UPI00345D0C27